MTAAITRLVAVVDRYLTWGIWMCGLLALLTSIAWTCSLTHLYTIHVHGADAEDGLCRYDYAYVGHGQLGYAHARIANLEPGVFTGSEPFPYGCSWGFRYHDLESMGTRYGMIMAMPLWSILLPLLVLLALAIRRAHRSTTPGAVHHMTP